MGLIAKALAPIVRNEAPPMPYTSMGGASYSQPRGNYLQLARAYATNEFVASAIDLLATSAAEPHIVGRRMRREKAQTLNAALPLTGMPLEQARDEVRGVEMSLVAKGMPRAQVRQWLVRNQFVEELPRHPLVKLLNNPNPFMSRGQFTSTLVMDRMLAGNSYALKGRYQSGPLNNAVAELWRLRPDRVRVIPGGGYIEAYEYTAGQEKVIYPAADVMHFKTLNPLNEYYGMPPLMQLLPWVEIQAYMQRFLSGFFERGGSGPGAILTSKARVPQEMKDEIRARYKVQFGGPAGAHELMVLDNTESTYQQMGLNRGLRDALPKELSAEGAAAVAMRFGIPGSILGILPGYESSSYANKRQDWQVLWDITMTPLLSDMDDTMNLSIVPDFGGIDEVGYDLSDIKALQEDVDKLHDRHRKNWMGSVEFWEEARDGMGLDPNGEGTLLIPANMIPVRVRKGGVIELPEPEVVEPPKQIEGPKALMGEISCPTCSSRLPVSRVEGSATIYCRHCKNEVEVGDVVEKPRDIIEKPRDTVKEIEYDAKGRMVRVKESAA